MRYEFHLFVTNMSSVFSNDHLINVEHAKFSSTLRIITLTTALPTWMHSRPTNDGMPELMVSQGPDAVNQCIAVVSDPMKMR